MKTQPAKHIRIPSGATHWNHGHTYPFEKHLEDGTRYIYIEGEWQEHPPCPIHGYRNGAVKLEEAPATEEQRVLTLHGEGALIGKEQGRYLVDLDNGPFDFRPVAYMKKEITLVEGDKEMASLEECKMRSQDPNSVYSLGIEALRTYM